MNEMVHAENLTRRYGDVAAVDGVSFSIRQGEVVGLLGPNGAGKSTTMKMLTCYIPPTSGRILLDGLDVVEDSLKVRERIGYLPESVPLYDDMGVYDYLAFVAEVRRIPPVKRRQVVRGIMHRCGLDQVLGKGISELSKGYRQRVGLAQAMLHDPPVLVLDEPTTGLDPNQIVEIRELIRELGREKTVLLSTHILQEVEATCDRVLIINEGKIITDSTPARLHAEFRGAQELELLVSGAEERELSRAMGELPGVQRVETGRADGREVSLTVVSQMDQDLREAIFRLCVTRGWVLLEMRRNVVSLEAIFRKLTSGETA